MFVLTVSQLCLLCVCACSHLLVLSWSHLNFPEGKEAPAVLLFDKALPKIDRIVCAVCFPPMELKNSTNAQSQLRPAAKNSCLRCFYSWINWVKLSSLAASCSLLIIIIAVMIHSVHQIWFGKREKQNESLRLQLWVYLKRFSIKLLSFLNIKSTSMLPGVHIVCEIIISSLLALWVCSPLKGR